ncbi:hypothetical protein RF11_05279 [Thelohanellus kitauei]|uniref:Uncharacterized protein n=1 Tax=Thelohanellus kitauei TaxID=669202 RepID=A0A0C2IUF2_THEKT|nr:hypothetical protein RF11_05279 [Thelohanellus kitauei]
MYFSALKFQINIVQHGNIFLRDSYVFEHNESYLVPYDQMNCSFYNISMDFRETLTPGSECKMGLNLTYVKLEILDSYKFTCTKTELTTVEIIKNKSEIYSTTKRSDIAKLCTMGSMVIFFLILMAVIMTVRWIKKVRRSNRTIHWSDT